MDFSNRMGRQNRRTFLVRAATAAALLPAAFGRAQETITLPFENGERRMATYPQKRPMILLTTRPPQLETPFSVFNESVLTPNDAHFVRYHLSIAPPAAELLAPETFRVTVKGRVKTPLELSVADLKAKFEAVQTVAVNQCSGNSRGFFNPRVPGGQLGNGAMGNARWTGVRLRDVLNQAGLEADAVQVVFNGMDKGPMPTITDFVKSLDTDHALDRDILLAYEMNGEPLPWLNGFPLRLVVPGHYGTYWVKHLNEITVVDKTFKGFWMDPAYRIPDNAGACVPPGTAPGKTVPIARFNVRSFLTSLENGAKIKTGESLKLRGIAFDGGYGIREVIVSTDGGRSWTTAALGEDLGKYSFREWTLPFTPKAAGDHTLLVKATNSIGQSQPMEPLWNPSGYMRNVVESVTVTAS